jgi:hypothetical protein
MFDLTVTINLGLLNAINLNKKDEFIYYITKAFFR